LSQPSDAIELVQTEEDNKTGHGGDAAMKKISILIIAVAVLTGFTSVTSSLRTQMAQLPHHYSQFDAKLGWEVTSGTAGMTINGIFQNVRYARMENIEIWASLRDSKGKVVAQAVDYLIPGRLERDDLARFHISLPGTAHMDGTLIFTYRYIGEDGGEETGGGDNYWMQSFEAK
jgi:hypothetical protein